MDLINILDLGLFIFSQTAPSTPNPIGSRYCMRITYIFKVTTQDDEQIQ